MLLYRFLVLGTNLFNPSALCEVLSEVVLFGQNVIARSSDVRSYHMFLQVFPRVVACDMKLFGVTGSFTKASGLCTLPINIVNEKIYLVLWLTFIAASLVSLLQLLHQALFLAPVFRPYVIPRLSSSTLVSRKVIRVV